jgi:hypothetical protein
MKYGAYVTSWTLRLNRPLRISFSASARMIAIGKLAATVYTESRKVFFTRVQNTGFWKNNSKFFQPIHGLPQMPLVTLKFLNASTAFAIGMYLKTPNQISGTTISR